MRVWRLCRRAHGAFDGEGARRFGGRWSLRGTPVVYTSASAALATLEYFVHLDVEDAPPDLVLIAADAPGSLAIEEIRVGRLPREWRRTPAPEALARLGRNGCGAGARPCSRCRRPWFPSSATISSIRCTRTSAPSWYGAPNGACSTRGCGSDRGSRHPSAVGLTFVATAGTGSAIASSAATRRAARPRSTNPGATSRKTAADTPIAACSPNRRATSPIVTSPSAPPSMMHAERTEMTVARSADATCSLVQAA